MRKICLSFDAIDSEKYQQDPNSFKELLISLLEKNGCTTFEMPVSNTLVFNCPIGFGTLRDAISPALKKHVYFYLCSVAVTDTKIRSFQYSKTEFVDGFEGFLTSR